MQPTIETRTSLARKYGIHKSTLVKMINDISDLKLNPKIRILSPKQVQIIYEELGEPPGTKSKNNQ